MTCLGKLPASVSVDAQTLPKGHHDNINAWCSKAASFAFLVPVDEVGNDYEFYCRYSSETTTIVPQAGKL